MREGLAETFVEAGAVFSTPTCGPCLGGHMGILAKGERAIATTNRNFVGRMGHPESEVYLANPVVAAASAVLGVITSYSIHYTKLYDGRRVHDGVRMLVFPATREIYLQAMREGLMETFVEAGAVFSTPTCGPCLGGHMGILAKGERAISTTNRNFVGRRNNFV